MTEAYVYEEHSNNVDANISTTASYVNLNQTKKVYTRRWYVLLVYGITAMLQGFIWNMWGPIFDSMDFIYGWSDRQLALLPFYGTVTFAIFVIPSALFLEIWGLRKLVLVMSGLVALSAVIKCIPGPDIVVTTFVNLSAIINGLAGSVVFFIPAYMSAHWFTTHERKLATTLGTLINGLGVALPFVVGPSFISEPNLGVSKDAMKNQYLNFTYTLAGITCTIFLVILSYFPSKPPLPPTDSALVQRINGLNGFKQLMKNKPYLCLCISSTLLLGTFGGWMPVLSLDLASQNVHEHDAGMLGFYGSIVGLIVAVFVGALADRFGSLKLILIALTILSIESSLWLLLVLHGYIEFTLRSTYVAYIIASISTTSSWSLRFEMASELCYPVDESLSVGFLGLVMNVWTSLFLSVLFVNGIGTAWIDYSLVLCSILSLPFLIVMKESYKRSEMDKPQIILHDD